MPITLFYAGCLALVFVILSARAIQRRGQTGVNLGDGGNEVMIRIMRGHANFAEYVPLSLVLIAALELQGLGAAWVHGLGASLLLGRVLHGYAFGFSEYFPIGRTGGTALTLGVLIVAGALAVWMGLAAL